MMLLAFGITVMLIMGSTALWKHSVRESTLFFTVAGTLALLFYRKKLALLAAAACGFILVNAGLRSFSSQRYWNIARCGIACRLDFFLVHGAEAIPKPFARQVATCF
jgi:hypothetical protein